MPAAAAGRWRRAAVQIDLAAAALELDRVLDQRQTVQLQARLLKELVLRDVEAALRDVVAAGVEERREDDRAPDWARVRDVAAGHAVLPAGVAASLVDLLRVALEGMLVAQAPARARRIEGRQAPLVELSHLVHATHAHGLERAAALVPEGLVHGAAHQVAVVHRVGVPHGGRVLRWRWPAPAIPPCEALGVRGDLLQVLVEGADVAGRPLRPRGREKKRQQGDKEEEEEHCGGNGPAWERAGRGKLPSQRSCQRC